MNSDRLFEIGHIPENSGGVYKNPSPGIYEREKPRRPQLYDFADTASPKAVGNHTTIGLQRRALIIHPEFPIENS